MSGLQYLFTRSPDIESLSDLESVRAEAMEVRRREQFVLGRTALRTLAGKILGVPAREVPLEISESGAPILSNAAFHVSLSHSGCGALAAVAGTPVGCDLESLHGRAKDFPALADRFFHASEARTIRDAAPEVRQILFLRSWTRKEAAYKCGVLDWSRCLRHPWSEGDNALEAGTMVLRDPDGLQEGWIGSLAIWSPKAALAQPRGISAFASSPGPGTPCPSRPACA